MLLNRFLWSGYCLFHSFGQKNIPFISPQRWERLQKKRLRQMVRHAYESVPFYRSYMIQNGLQPEEFNSVSDLQKFPLISKEIVMKNPEDFFSGRYQKNQCLELKTSGTTGQPASVWHDRRSIILHMANARRETAVFTHFLKKNSGIRVMRFLGPGSITEKVIRYHDYNVFRPGWVKTTQIVVPITNTMSTNLDLLAQYKPDIVTGYGSYLGALFQYAAKHLKKFYMPQIVMYSADSLSETDRELIETDLGTPVLSVYKACESFKIGFMCEAGKGFHMHPDLCPVYLVDKKGEPAGPGECGEVVISNLLNRATVLLNYRLGDLAVLEENPCRCGRTFPLLRSIEGRVNEMIELPDGKTIHPEEVGHVFSLRRDVERYQVIQRGTRSFTVKVRPRPAIDISTETLKQELKEEFQHLFGHQAQIDILFVKSFPVTGHEKFRPVVVCKNSEDVR